MAPDAFRDTLWRHQGEVIAVSPFVASGQVPGTTPRRDRAATVRVRARAGSALPHDVWVHPPPGAVHAKS